MTETQSNPKPNSFVFKPTQRAPQPSHLIADDVRRQPAIETGRKALVTKLLRKIEDRSRQDIMDVWFSSHLLG